MRKRDEERAREKIKLRGKLPSYAHDNDEPPPKHFKSANEPKQAEDTVRNIPEAADTFANYVASNGGDQRNPQHDATRGSYVPTSPQQTKSDFPTIMTRGRVTNGRLDVALESNGSIFGGRDEK